MARAARLCLAITLFAFSQSAMAAVDTDSSLFIMPSATYQGATGSGAYGGTGLTLLSITLYTATAGGPSPNLVSVPAPPSGNFAISSFSDVFAAVTIDTSEGPFDDSGPASGQASILGSGAGGTGVFATELTGLQVFGNGTGIMLRESPTLASTGQTTITDLGGGLFRIHSFFDVFTELSLDLGNTWHPAPGTTHLQITSVPEPATAAVAAAGAGLLLAARRCRRR